MLHMIYIGEYHILHVTWTPLFCACTQKSSRTVQEKTKRVQFSSSDRMWIGDPHEHIRVHSILNRAPNLYRFQFVNALPNCKTKINRIIAFVSAFLHFVFSSKKVDRPLLRRAMICKKNEGKNHIHVISTQFRKCGKEKKASQVSNWNSLQMEERVKV